MQHVPCFASRYYISAHVSLPLLQGLGLEENLDKPVVAVITRLVPQKGIHLIKAALFRSGLQAVQ